MAVAGVGFKNPREQNVGMRVVKPVGNQHGDLLAMNGRRLGSGLSRRRRLGASVDGKHEQADNRQDGVKLESGSFTHRGTDRPSVSF